MYPMSNVLMNATNALLALVREILFNIHKIVPNNKRFPYFK